MLTVPLNRQKYGHCGPASLKMLLGFFGVNESHEKLAKLTKATGAAGTSHKNLVSAAEKLGFKVISGENGSWKLLDDYLNTRKLPVLVDWFSETDGHYSVALALTKNSISIADPEYGKVRKLSWKTFNRVWFDFAGDELKHKKDIYLRWYMVLEK